MRLEHNGVETYQDATTCCFNKIATVWANVNYHTIDVPELGNMVMNHNVGANANFWERLSMPVIILRHCAW